MVWVALTTFATDVCNRRLICFTDNEANVKAFYKGASNNPLVHSLICELYWTQLRLHVELRLVFIPGLTNAVADLISRTTSDEAAMKALPHLRFSPALIPPFTENSL
ncbi:hypothetical protein HDU93_006045, partial [Gonapodya sp. JEL0774]